MMVNKRVLARAIRVAVQGVTDGGGDSEDSEESFEFFTDGMRFDLDHGNLKGLLHRESYLVQCDDGRKVEPLFRDFEIDETLTFAHRDLPTDGRFGCHIISELEATLTAEPPHEGTVVTLYNMSTTARYATVDVPRRTGEIVSSMAIMKKLMDVVRRGKHKYAASEFGITNTLFVNKGAINIFPESSSRSRHGIRSDDILAQAWMGTFRAASEDEQGMYRIVDTGSSFCFFDKECGLWREVMDKNIASNCMLASMNAVSGGAFYKSLTVAERKYVGSAHGGMSVFRRTRNHLFAPDFKDRLDANMRIFPFDNGVYDLDSKVFRPLRWDDYVSFTAGYSMPASVDDETAAFVEEFYRQVLPVAEERELVLRMAGSTLCGMPLNKKFLVLQDHRGGDNGKSMVLESFSAALGRFAVPTQLNFLTLGRCPDANGQQSATLLYRGKRLAIFDETDPELRMDMTRLKSITGGAPSLTARGMYDKKSTEFRWTAFVMIGCNEACLPKINSSDAAFMKRMVTVPMRSKFCDKAVAAGEPLSFPASVGVKERIRAAAGAIMCVLVAAYERYVADGESFGEPSEGCEVLKASVILVSDPKLQFVTSVVDQVVDFDPGSQSSSSSKSPKVPYVERKHLMTALANADKKSILGKVPVANVKMMVDTVMEAHHRKLNDKINPTKITSVYNVYRDCVLRDHYFLKNDDTSSMSERTFRDAFELASGIVFEHNVRLVWLKNPVTLHTMELDMFCAKLKLAIEYDGPHHYVYPNQYHKDQDEFRAQQARDVAKNELCLQKGVTLVRVRGCEKGVAEEVRWCMDQIKISRGLDLVANA
jgi:very-short-patch-repair endonuclease